MKTITHWLGFVLALVAASAFAQGGGKTELLWLGQACFRITTPGGKVIVTDPWLKGNPTTPAAYKDLDALGKIDLVLVTHAHGDHFADAPELVRKNNVPIYAPQGLQASMQVYGIVPPELARRMGKGGTVMPFGPSGVKITAVHAEHDGELRWKDANGKEMVVPGGEPWGYIIEMENGFRIYHMGDTDLFGDMKLIAERYHPDLVLAPIGGNFVMNPQDAAFAVKTWLHPKYAIPIHYGTNPLMKGTPEEFVKAMGDSPVKVFPIKPGDKLEF